MPGPFESSRPTGGGLAVRAENTFGIPPENDRIGGSQQSIDEEFSAMIAHGIE